ncbi:hypothetical protein OFP26_36065, partial [Escherichia coli]|nr:hypothetical protein [Escherichia coli]
MTRASACKHGEGGFEGIVRISDNKKPNSKVGFFKSSKRQNQLFDFSFFVHNVLAYNWIEF